MELSNREVAILLWFFIFSVWALFKAKVGRQLIDMLRILVTSRSILIIISSMTFYVLGSVYFLDSIDYWNAEHTKNTIIWFGSVALVTMFRSNKAVDDEHYFKKAILDNLKLIAVIEFVINFHTLSIWSELVLIPITFSLGAVHAYTEVYDREGYDEAHKLVTNLLVIIVVALLAYEITQIYNNPGKFFTIGTLVDFTMPIVLSMMFLPFMYLLVVYMLYENIFGRLRLFIDEPSHISYTKLLTVTNFHISVPLLRHWSKNIHMIDYSTRESIKNGISSMRPDV